MLFLASLRKNGTSNSNLQVWHNYIPGGGVARGIISSYALFPRDKCVYTGVDINSGSFTYKGFIRASEADEQKWIPTF